MHKFRNSAKADLNPTAAVSRRPERLRERAGARAKWPAEAKSHDHLPVRSQLDWHALELGARHQSDGLDLHQTATGETSNG